jgi:hypothetical protein
MFGFGSGEEGVEGGVKGREVISEGLGREVEEDIDVGGEEDKGLSKGRSCVGGALGCERGRRMHGDGADDENDMRSRDRRGALDGIDAVGQAG